ncbi:predicted protein [Histoplasma capsulatum var. duboisii H88]|uniref:Predicted protein n=1 Tax=Ajellomyces capsulatus (strain H88) TaxID=544711 RepID=F0U8Y1_AJEC8|nr:predicted protein [Histoplasma capsulatum var. duboisii H88]
METVKKRRKILSDHQQQAGRRGRAGACRSGEAANDDKEEEETKKQEADNERKTICEDQRKRKMARARMHGRRRRRRRRTRVKSVDLSLGQECPDDAENQRLLPAINHHLSSQTRFLLSLQSPSSSTTPFTVLLLLHHKTPGPGSQHTARTVPFQGSNCPENK